MALKIQLRRDTAANWISNNPLLLNGEIGIETDTLKFKVGNGSQRWNSIEFYAFKAGAANGVATLDSSGKVPTSQLPIFNSVQDLESAIQAALSAKTTSNIAEGNNLYFTNARVLAALNSANTSNIAEGSNLYFTNARAIAAGQTAFDPIGSASQAVTTAATNTATKISDLINTAPASLNTLSELATAIENNSGYVNNVVNLVAGKQDILTAGNSISILNNTVSVLPNTFDTKGSALNAENNAAIDATTKAGEAVLSAAIDATSKANSAKADAIATAAADATSKANAVITTASQDATSKANSAKADAIATAAADATSKANLAEAAAISAAATDATTKSNFAITTAASMATQAITNSINSLTTSDIEEGTNKYFTDARAKAAVASDISSAIAAIPPGGPGSISSTTDLAEGSNLYFTNARAVTATNTARTNILLSALGAVDDLRIELHGDLENYLPLSEINVMNGVAGLDLNSKIQDSAIPSTIARTSDITAAVANIVNLAPASLDTLGELATAFQSDQSGLAAVVTTLGTKLDSSVAASTYSPIASPTFTGVVTIPAGALISGYATSVNLTAALDEAKSYTDTARNGINNSLGGYQPESEKNQASGYAGLDISGKILTSVLPLISNAMLTNSTININGSEVALGSSVITGYTNGISGSNVNKITYGASATPPASGNSAGDIYIQY